MIKSVLPRWAAWTASAHACMPHQARGGTYVHWFSYLKIVFKLCLKSRAAAELSVTKYVPSSCQFLTESRFTCDRSATVAGDCGSVDGRWCNNYARVWTRTGNQESLMIYVYFLGDAGIQYLGTYTHRGRTMCWQSTSQVSLKIWCLNDTRITCLKPPPKFW